MTVLFPFSDCRLIILTCLLSISSTTPYNITATIEAPFIQRSSAGFDYIGIETFDSMERQWYETYETNFGLGSNSNITGTYSNVLVVGSSMFGGAMGNGSYPTCPSGETIRLNLRQVGEHGLNYFGLWLSALDSYNSFEFYFQGSKLIAFEAQDVISLVRDNPDYYGNPTTNPRVDLEEIFVFMNFYFNDVLIDEVRIIQAPGVAKCESDNHTIGFFINQTGTEVPIGTAPAVGIPVGVIIGGASGGVAVLAAVVFSGMSVLSGRAGAPSSPELSGQWEANEPAGKARVTDRNVEAGIAGEEFT